jgi:hypothetical protein
VRRLAPCVLVAIVAGCGGSGGGSLSHAELIRRANAICAKFNQQLKALPQPKNPLEIGAYVEKAVPLEQVALRSLRNLRPPKSDESTYTLFVAQIQHETTLAQNELVPAAQAPTNPKRVRFILTKLAAMDKQANTLANSLGLTVCGRSASG